MFDTKARGLLQSLRISVLERYETLSIGILVGATTNGDYFRQMINCGETGIDTAMWVRIGEVICLELVDCAGNCYT